MSYKLPFSNPAVWSVKKVFLLGLVILHAVWIVIHLNLVSRELANPWKLGGYGMYTTANKRPMLHIFDRRFNQFLIPLTANDRAKIGRANNFFVFRCQPMTEHSLESFFTDNPRLIGFPLRFIVTERKMMRNPLQLKRLPYSVVDIRWTGQSTFDYGGEVCGERYNGEAELKP